MEMNIAILMADLSGYTALTETHGSAAAADIIDKYIAIVENCLVGDSRVHERTGDELMIVSSSPDFLLATALVIGKDTSNEENFLMVHGGLHDGKVLMRGNSYFGTAINITSRIASKANAGTYWCSDEFVNALSDKTVFTAKSQGNHFFKNIKKEKEVFEICIEDRTAFYIDPVCRMLIIDPKKAIPHPTDGDQYFCSSDCLEIYMKEYQDA
jgi:class 3 adenylate cyclase